MATSEERQHAERMLTQYQWRLRLLEERKARQGDASDPSTDIEIAELRANVSTLDALLEPEPAEEVKETVRRAGDGDWAFMFAQFVKYGTRLTKNEERVEVAIQISREVQLALFNVGEDVKAIRDSIATERDDRVSGQHINRWIGMATLGVVVVLALASFVWLRLH